jgi:hypothetical protein
MTNSENIFNFGANAYGKPATALNILRETVMGRELFDFAFKNYCNRWAFKHPEPADFFRSMEDASAVDLDWFWRGWFYDIDPVDVSLDTVKIYSVNKGMKVAVKMDTVYTPDYKLQDLDNITAIRNRQSGIIPLIEKDTTLRDFYYHYKPSQTTIKEVKNSNENMEEMPDSLFAKFNGKYVYELKFTNKGGLVTPLIIQFNYADGTSEIERIGAYIWRKNEKEVTKTFLKNKVASIVLDPYKETADINEKNNTWNIKNEPGRFDMYKAKTGAAARGQSSGQNLMQRNKGK